MQSRTEMKNSQKMHSKNLPRGYFKKRKHQPEHDRPPDQHRAQKNSFSLNSLACINTKYPEKLLIFLIPLMALTVGYGNATTTIEPDLKVLSLERTQISEPQLANGNGCE